MKKFILNTISFVGILIGLNIVFYNIVQFAYVKNYNDYSFNFKSYLLSDSHGGNLSTMTEKYGVYNFSSASDSYFYMYRKLNFLIKNTKIDTVYITADDHTLSSYREKSNNMDRSVVYSDPNEYDNFYLYLKSFYAINYIVFFQPKALSVVKSYFFSLIKPLPHNKIDDITWDKLSNKMRLKNSKFRFNTQFNDDTSSFKLKESLARIIQKCKQNNIVLIGIKFPLTFNYIDLLKNNSYGADSILINNGIKILDYKDVFCNKNQYFENADHLNNEGAQKFIEHWLNSK